MDWWLLVTLISAFTALCWWTKNDGKPKTPKSALAKFHREVENEQDGG